MGFDFEEHCYTASVNGKPAKPAAGVTSIIKETLGLDQRLANWMVKEAHDFMIDGIAPYVDGNETIQITRSLFEKLCKDAKGAHRKKSKDATDIGTVAHDFAEKTLKQISVEMPANLLARNAAEAFLQWTTLTKLEPIDIERMVFSEKWWYAGTCDYYGKIDGKLAVLDLKTSSGLYREMPLQLAAYAVALEEETGETIEQGWIIRLCKKTGNCEPYPIPLTKRLKDDWMLVRGAHRALGRLETTIKLAKENLYAECR